MKYCQYTLVQSSSVAYVHSPISLAILYCSLYQLVLIAGLNWTIACEWGPNEFCCNKLWPNLEPNSDICNIDNHGYSDLIKLKQWAAGP